MTEPHRQPRAAPEIFQVRLADLDPGIVPVGAAPGTPAFELGRPRNGFLRQAVARDPYDLAVGLRGGA